MFRRISIDGFRGIDGLALEDFRRVNVLVGPNGGGKTSVLEAISLAAQPFALQGLDMLNQWRDMPKLNARTWHSLLTIFSHMDCHRTVLLEIETEQGQASIEISAILGAVATEDSEAVEGPVGNLDSASGLFEDTVRGVRSLCQTSWGHQVEGVLELLGTGYQHTAKAKPKGPARGPVPGIFFVHARRATSLAETADALTTLYAKKAERSFMDAVNKVDPRVIRLIPGMQGKQPTVLADVGHATLVPISVLGDGFCRVSLMVTGMVSAERGRLLIVDEIDSGLHHSTMNGLWHSILSLSREYDFQVFCSTHNEEMLRATLNAFSNEPEALRVYRISRNRDGVVSQQKYDYKMLQDAHAMAMDIR